LSGRRFNFSPLKIFNTARSETVTPDRDHDGTPETEALAPDTPVNTPVTATRRWQKWGPHLLVLVLYSLITLYFLQPLIARFFTDVPFGGDSWIFYWDLWWVKKALTELGTNPFYTTYVNYPGGASLNSHTLAFLDGVIAIPLQWLGMSLAGAYNSLVLFGYIFSAYGMFLLADYLVKNKWAAFVAGLIFGFSPFHFAHLNGQLNFVSIQWMPFYVLFMLKAASSAKPLKTRQTWLNILIAAVFLALNALTEWTLAAFLGLLTVLYLLYRLWRERKEWRAALRGPVLRLVLVLLVFGVLTSPVLLPMLNEARSNKNIAYNPQETIFYSADLLSFITPYELHPVLGSFSEKIAEKFSGNPAERTNYLGFVGLILAIVALVEWWRTWWRTRRKKAKAVTDPAPLSPAGPGFWSVSAVFFALLALGPKLTIGGRDYFTVFRLDVLLPYALFYYLPFFSIMRTPTRFDLLAILALAILAAFGFKALAGWVGWRRTGKPAARWVLPGLSAVVSLLILFEFAPYVTTAYPNVPPIYNPVRQDTNPNHAVLELPLRPAAHFYIAQVAYSKPMIGGYLARQVDNPLIEQNPALKTLALLQPATTGSVGQLKEAGISYVFVNWWMLDDTQTTQMQAALGEVFGRPPDDTQMEPDGSKLRLSLYIIK
jgi:hypothetical protein